jgi:hypothetical protein
VFWLKENVRNFFTCYDAILECTRHFVPMFSYEKLPCALQDDVIWWRIFTSALVNCGQNIVWVTLLVLYLFCAQTIICTQLFAGKLTNQNWEYYKVSDNINYTMTPGLTSLLGRLGLHSMRDIYVCKNDKLSCFVYENCPEKITCMNEIDYKMLWLSLCSWLISTLWKSMNTSTGKDPDHSRQKLEQ